MFGCKAMVHVPKEKRRKWDVKSRELIFVGCSEETKGYRFIHPDTKQLIKSRDAVFIENQSTGNISANKFETNNLITGKQVVLPFKEGGIQVEDKSGAPINPTNTNDVKDRNQVNLSSDTEDDSFVSAGSNDAEVTVVVRRRSERVPKQRIFPDCVSYFVHGTDPEDPQTVEAAMSRHDSELSKKAMSEEFDALQENNT